MNRPGRPQKGQTSGGKGSNPGGGFVKNWVSDLFGGGNNANNAVTIQQPEMDATDEAGQPIKIPNTTFNANAPATANQKSFLGLWNYTPSANKALADSINTTIGTNVANQRAMQPGILSQAQAESNINLDRVKQQSAYEQGLKDKEQELNLGRTGESIIRLHLPQNGEQVNGGLGAIPGGSTNPQNVARDWQNQYGTLGQTGVGAVPSLLSSTISGNRLSDLQNQNQISRQQGMAPFMSQIGTEQGKAAAQEPALGIQTTTLANTGKSIANQFVAPNQFRVNPYGDPITYLAGPGEKVNTQFMTVKGPDGKPMQIKTGETKVATPPEVTPIQPPISAQELAAALQGNQGGMPDDASKYGFQVPQKTASLPQTTIQPQAKASPTIADLLILLLRPLDSMEKSIQSEQKLKEESAKYPTKRKSYGYQK